MEFYIHNTALELVGIIDTFSSVIWTVKYNGVGDFELYFPAKEEILSVIKKNYFVTRPDSESAMIIKTIKFDSDEENGDFATITGVSLESILSQRVVWFQTNLNGRVEDCINQLIYTNCIAPIDPERVIPGLKLGEYKGFADNLNAQYEAINLLDCIMQICDAYALGFKIIISGGNLIFQLYKGLDRSYNQDVNAWVVFSDDFDNLFQSSYIYDSSNYKNVALVGGEGEGIYKKYSSYGSGAGLARYETFVDGSSVSSNNGDIATASYSQLLQYAGQEALLECRTNETVDGAVNYDSYKYGVDYGLGDVVQIKTKQGIEATPRIIAITENEDESGYKIYPTFTDWGA